MPTTDILTDNTTCSALHHSHGLTRREEQVLRGITNGLTNDEIARGLFLSLNTVKTYIRSVYSKIDLADRSHAIIWGVRHGMLEGVTASEGAPEDPNPGPNAPDEPPPDNPSGNDADRTTRLLVGV